MNSHLKQFVVKYLTVVFATLMSASFVAFLSIPYNLSSHFSDEAAAQTSLSTPAPTAPQV
jgi:hypothetical protein